MQPIHHGLRPAETRIRNLTISGEKRAPCRLDDPVDYPGRMRLPQSCHGREGMQHVAHGSQTDHEQAVLGLRLQS